MNAAKLQPKIAKEIHPLKPITKPIGTRTQIATTATQVTAKTLPCDAPPRQVWGAGVWSALGTLCQAGQRILSPPAGTPGQIASILLSCRLRGESEDDSWADSYP